VSLLETEAQLKAFIESQLMIVKANIASILKTKLIEYIQEFYSEYSPAEYQRTSQFLTSPESEVFTDRLEVFLDPLGIHYEEIQAEEVWELAAEGYHGNVNIRRDSRFWKDFNDYVNGNLYHIFKNELKKIGFEVI